MTIALNVYTVLCTKTGSMTFPADSVWFRVKHMRQHSIDERAHRGGRITYVQRRSAKELRHHFWTLMRTVHSRKGVRERVSRAHHPYADLPTIAERTVPFQSIAAPEKISMLDVTYGNFGLGETI